MHRSLYAFLNNCLNILPPHGRALDLRGRLAAAALAGAGARLRLSSQVNIYNPAGVTVGSHVYIGYSTYLGGGTIVLGDEVIIGPFCSIVGANHTRRDGSYRYGPHVAGKVVIGDGTWLASHVTVTPDVTIGKGCLVAAGAVVTRDVPDNTLVGGVPARVIGPAP